MAKPLPRGFAFSRRLGFRRVRWWRRRSSRRTSQSWGGPMPQPTGQTRGRQPHCRAFDEQDRPDLLLLSRPETLVRFDVCRAFRPRSRTSFRRRYPSLDEREGFGRAHGALLLRVNFFAVEAEAGDSELHRLSVPGTATSAFTPRFDYCVVAVGKNLGGRRLVDACSYAYANAISFASLQARPMNEIPIGRPRTSPAGTVTFG
jgi:hypothetical protein